MDDDVTRLGPYDVSQRWADLMSFLLGLELPEGSHGEPKAVTWRYVGPIDVKVEFVRLVRPRFFLLLWPVI